MRYVSARAFALFSSLALVACSAAPGSEESTTRRSGEDLASETKVTFGADWTTKTSGPLVSGRKVAIVYDAARVTDCKGDLNGGPAWSTTAFYRTDGGVIASVNVAGHVADPSVKQGEITLTAPGDLELWFQTTNAWGCSTFDSAFGANYHLTVAPPPGAPSWMGNTWSVISRATCDGGPCAGDGAPLSQGFSFDTWARERAAVARVEMEVWERGITDFDNPDLWEQLDVELHFRVGGQGPYAMSYVSFDRRLGNNARYAVDLRALDPLPGAHGGALTSASDCPTFPTTLSPDGMQLVADVDFWLSVNGAELRPANGGTFHGTFSNYAGLYAICHLH